MIDFETEYQEYLKSEIDIIPKQDINQDTPDGKVSYEEGKRVGVERRIARQLVKDGQATFADSMIKSLKQSITKENLLDENKISSVHKYMYLDIKFEISLLDPFDKVKAEGLFRTLTDKRSHKIIRLASTDNNELTKQLALEELELFDTIQNSYMLFRERIG